MKVPFSYLDSKFKGCMSPKHPIYKNLVKLMRTGDFTLGEAVQTFERKVEKLLKVKHAIGVANGTDALRIALRLAGVGPGDEVIVPANTFIASAGCVDELFAKPVYVDIDNSYTIDPKLITHAITSKTKAILPVHFTGQPADMDSIMHIAEKHGIPVIEDACQALMAERWDSYCGTIGLAGAVSLHPLKVLNGTGDGGLILTNDDDFAARVRLYRNHGLKNRNEVAGFGCNSRLDTIQAVFLNYLIDFVEEWTAKRLWNANYYDTAFSTLSNVEVVKRHSLRQSCFHLYFIEVGECVRDHLVTFLNKAGIEARVHYPIPLQGALRLRHYGRAAFPVAYKKSARIVTLPVHEHLTKKQLDFVVSKVKEFFG